MKSLSIAEKIRLKHYRDVLKANHTLTISESKDLDKLSKREYSQTQFGRSILKKGTK